MMDFLSGLTVTPLVAAIVTGAIGGMVSWLSLPDIYRQIKELRAELHRLKAKYEGSSQ